MYKQGGRVGIDKWKDRKRDRRKRQERGFQGEREEKEGRGKGREPFLLDSTILIPVMKTVIPQDNIILRN